MVDESSDFVTHTCVSVRCGACKEPYHDDDLGQVHFEDRVEAAKRLTNVGWTFNGESARCKGCALVEECAVKGHVWDDWWHCRCGCHGERAEPMNRDHGRPMECRTCARCDDHEDRVHAVMAEEIEEDK
jgi:hypothetical protein